MEIISTIAALSAAATAGVCFAISALYCEGAAHTAATITASNASSGVVGYTSATTARIKFSGCFTKFAGGGALSLTADICT